MHRHCSPACYLRDKTVVSPSGCWEWQGAKQHFGHGQASWSGEKYLAHRLSYQTFTGPIQQGNVIRHKCNNPPCCNPTHLVQGTVADNVRDMWDRGRARCFGRPSTQDIIVRANERLKLLLLRQS